MNVQSIGTENIHVRCRTNEALKQGDFASFPVGCQSCWTGCDRCVRMRRDDIVPVFTVGRCPGRFQSSGDTNQGSVVSSSVIAVFWRHTPHSQRRFCCVAAVVLAHCEGF